VHQYLFGAPARPRPPSRQDPCDTFVLGAYPSAVYCRWAPPGLPAIAAIAVADEPEPFWEGADEQATFDKWARAVQWRAEWGEASAAGRLNGSSGTWLARSVLGPLGIARSSCWITDCLDTYHESKAAAQRLNTREYRSFIGRLRIPDRNLPPHPSEAQIVRNAQRDRLIVEIRHCRPRRVITLGNAALRVFASVLDGPPPTKRLSPKPDYGVSHSVTLPAVGSAEWIPLAHPAAPLPYQRAHEDWARRQGRSA